ncbi:Protein of unknown function [Lishizhenia tianjinensis]|uniref:DUF3703 domain-containing protein n=1 Tax=Lishizhenia tianjinensis TaxID=477690 RepID=A0A1I6XI23_9FLAO|nr:DUF3703 domain-containing protein [Lishizhenia tianjinensis]SFT37701.1 Protein of unknown function [Lishizhenia tianjinensis]
MKLYTRIPKSLKKHFVAEINAAQLAFDNNDLQKSWRHLERAHILGQRYPFTHNLAHWKMLVFGIRIKNFKEIIGQIPRLITGGVKSFVGKVPVGNPGGSNVHPLKPFPIPEDLALILVQNQL